MQIVEHPADCSLDGARFSSTHAVQKSASDQGVNVCFANFKQVAAKPTLTTFPHSFHAGCAGATVRGFIKRTGLRGNHDGNKNTNKSANITQRILADLQLFVTGSVLALG
jgi:hypothetical protein